MASKNQAAHADLAALCERYERVCADHAALDQHLQLTSLRRAPLVGLTTTALAKLSAVVAALQAEVVVVEDAPDVLESQLMVALSPSTQRLVLLGDPVLARPATAAHSLAKMFRLDASMFGRLLGQKVESAALDAQWRQRPELASLLSPLYARLECRPSLPPLPPLRGIEKPLFFVRHTKPESADGEPRSRVNGHEARFVAALAQYLVGHGYAPGQIAAVSPYCGQLLLLRKELKAAGVEGVAVSSADGLAGGEADVVLLSLVRSNERESVGALAADATAVACLSRARLGMYIIGNAAMHRAQSKLWASVVAHLEKHDAIGEFLSLSATRAESGRRALVRSADDFVGVVTEAEGKK